MLESIKKNKEITVFIAFLIIGLAIYANSFGNQFFWDDNDVVVNNVYVQHFDVGKMFSQSLISGAGQTTNYYRPVLLLSYALDYQLWGMNSFGFNLVDVLLHIANAWLIFILLYFLLSLRAQRSNLVGNSKSEIAASSRSLGTPRDDKADFWLACLPALIFLIHPLNTEAVDYVSGRADVLYASFALLSLLFYFNFSQAENTKKKIISYSAVALFFILSLLTKETAVVLPVAIVLIELVFISASSVWARLKAVAKKTWPLFGILAVYIVLHLTIFNFNHLTGALTGCLGDYCYYGIVRRALVFLLVCLNYFQILFLPLGLHMERAVSEFGSIYSWRLAAAIAAILAWAAAAIYFWRRERGIAFGLGWFFIFLFPSSGILVKLLYPTYEHFLYLPMIGFWLAFFCLLSLLLPAVRSNQIDASKGEIASSSRTASPRNDKGKVLLLARVIFCVMLVTCVVFWSFLTIQRNHDWHDPITFFQNNLKYSPQSFIEHTNLGMAYDDAGRFTEAEAEYRQSIAISDVYPQVHYDLAISLTELKKYDEAENEYLKAIAMSPGFITPYRNLYNLYVYLGKKDEADKIMKLLENIK
jgi:protein O-mannosyl-transferase